MRFVRYSGHAPDPQAPRLRTTAGLMIACGMLAVLFLAAFIVPAASAQPAEDHPTALLWQDGSGGQAIFDEKCAGCHTIGKGKLVGPDLQDVTKRRDAAWVKKFLLETDTMLSSDPAAQQLLKEYNNVPMPNMGLTEGQVDQLVQYLGDPSAVTAQAPALPASAGAGEPDPSAGQKLFTGELSLANGGPHCMACHTVSGTGSLGGGGLGPDLTHVYQRYGEPGLLGALKSIVFPTMSGPYRNRPLTAQEQADLVAFFKEADWLQKPVSTISAGALTAQAALVFGIGLVAAGLLFALLGFFWVRIKKNSAPHLPIRKV